jgi:hypothetical protein
MSRVNLYRSDPCEYLLPKILDSVNLSHYNALLKHKPIFDFPA